MNTLKDIIEMGGCLFEEAYNAGRRDAAQEIQGGGLAKLEDENEKLSEINSDLRSRIDDYQTKRAKLQKQVDTLEAEARERNATIIALEAANKVLGDKLEEANGRIERLNTELDEVSVENERLRERLEKETDEEPEPKPCPFCGKAPRISEVNFQTCIACVNEDCPVNPETIFFQTREEAIEAWNRRAE